MARTTWSAATLALILALPAAFAGWGAKGRHEPDTAWDVDAMWGGPDVSPNDEIRRIYFNGFGGFSAGGGTSANPNLAQVQSAILPTPYYPVAILGVWKDCNGDGYIGMADNGLLEYRSSLLLNDSICPATFVPPGGPAFLVHNDGAWVQELTPIGYDDVRHEPNGHVDSDPRNFNDTGARVWADWGLPDGAPVPACILVPMPRGTLQSTGGLLRWVDCYDRFLVSRAITQAAEAAGRPELGFSDAPDDQPDESRSPLNRPNPWGRPEDDASVTVFDCSRPAREVAVTDPTGGSLRRVEAGPISLNVTDSEGRIVRTQVREVEMRPLGPGSPAGTVNETQAGMSDCDRENAGEVLDFDGRPAGSDAGAPYFLESDTRAPPLSAPRTRSDFVLAFEEGDRRGGAAFLMGRTSTDANTGLVAVTGMWAGTSALRPQPDALVSRDEAAPAGVSHITYYAYVSSALLQTHALQTPPNAGGEYGAEACALAVPTFDCDPARWWRDADGKDSMPRDARLGNEPGAMNVPRQTPETEIGVRVGATWTLRDVDCVDFSATGARDAGVHWGALTGTSC